MIRICILAVLVLYIDIHLAHAGPYVEAAIGVEGKRQTSSLGIGYEHHGWFIEAVKPNLADLEHNEFLRDDGVGAMGLGGGITTTWESRQITTASTLGVHLGKLFDAGALRIGPFAGAHRYRETTAGASRLVKIDQATGEEIIDRSLYVNEERTGWAPTYGAMFLLPIAKHAAFTGRVTRYATIDRTAIEFGLRAEFGQ